MGFDVIRRPTPSLIQTPRPASRQWDGTAGNQVNLGDIASARFSTLSPWTILAAFRIASSADDRIIISKWTDQAAKNQIRIRTDGSTPNIEVGQANNSNRLIGSNDVALDTWYVLSVSCDGAAAGTTGTLHLVNLETGTFLDDGVTASFGSDVSDLTQDVWIGNRHPASDPMDGNIAHVVYIQKVATRGEIARYSKNPLAAVQEWSNQNVLEYYLPLGQGLDREPDFSPHKHDGIRSGTAATISGPPAPVSLIPLTRPFFMPQAAAPVGGRVMSSLVSHGGLAGAGGIAGQGGGLAG